MQTSIEQRTAFAAILGGALWLGLAVLVAGDPNLEDNPVWVGLPLVPAILASSGAGLAVLAPPASVSRIGGILLALSGALTALGFALMAWLNNDSGWSIMMAGLFTLPFGLIVFGAGNLREPVTIRWQWAALGAGILSLVFLLAIMGLGVTGLTAGYDLSIFLIMTGLGFECIGLGLWVKKAGSAGTPAAVRPAGRP